MKVRYGSLFSVQLPAVVFYLSLTYNSYRECRHSYGRFEAGSCSHFSLQILDMRYSFTDSFEPLDFVCYYPSQNYFVHFNINIYLHAENVYSLSIALYVICKYCENPKKIVRHRLRLKRLPRDPEQIYNHETAVVPSVLIT